LGSAPSVCAFGDHYISPGTRKAIFLQAYPGRL